jgi:hypothetical protein
MVHQPARHEGDEVALAQVLGVGLARRARLAGAELAARFAARLARLAPRLAGPTPRIVRRR